MKALLTPLKLAGALTILLFFTGCESTGDGGGNVSGGIYYGVGFYDPWYYGGYYYDDPDIIVTPPDRPDDRPRPEHPIAKPPTTTPRPMPSIPAAPRPMPMPRGRR